MESPRSRDLTPLEALEFIRHLNLRALQVDPKLPGRALAVLVYLEAAIVTWSRQADYVSAMSIARALGPTVTERHVRAELSRLHDSGLIVRHRASGGRPSKAEPWLSWPLIEIPNPTESRRVSDGNPAAIRRETRPNRDRKPGPSSAPTLARLPKELVHSAAAHANGHHEVTDNELATLIADVGAVNSFATEITTAWQQSSAGVQRCWESAQERGTKPAALLRRMLKDEDHLRSARRTKLTGSARTLAKAAEARRIEADGAK